MKRRRTLLAAALLVLPLLGACGDDEPALDDAGDDVTTTTEADAGTVAVEAKDYSFAHESSFEGGLVTFEMKNTGKEDHAFNISKLEEGKQLSDFLKALQSEQEGPPPPWVKSSGGTVAGPGGTSVYSIELAEGTYATMCPIPGPDGAPHFSKGMASTFTVTAPGADAKTAADLPAGDVTVVGKDISFHGFEGLKAGSQTVVFENQGKEDHEAVMIQVAQGKTAEDVRKFLSSDGPPQGPPPFAGFPGISSPVLGGVKAAATVELKPATTYVLVCFVGNQKGPHFAQGMFEEIKIT